MLVIYLCLKMLLPASVDKMLRFFFNNENIITANFLEMS